jgi:type II secretion system protein H
MRVLRKTRRSDEAPSLKPTPRRLLSGALHRSNVGGTAPWGGSSSGGFTLIELILVMVILAIVLTAAAPSLSRFFRARDLESEAMRFLALTRYGQSRAVSEGIPMMLWLDAGTGEYGLQANTTFVAIDNSALTYQMDEALAVEAELPILSVLQHPWSLANQSVDQLPTIRFTPDGYIAETSPERFLFTHTRDEDNHLWVGLSLNRLRYELQTNIVQQARR